MNLGGLAVLFLVICGAFTGLILIMSHTNTAAPVDSAGATTSIQENITRGNATGNTTAITIETGATWLIVIVAAMMMFLVVIYFVGARHGYKGRYQ